MCETKKLNEFSDNIIAKNSESEIISSLTMNDFLISVGMNILKNRNYIFSEAYFSDGFSGILTGIYDAYRHERRYSISIGDMVANAPATTMLRYIAKLESDGFIVQSADPADRQRAFLELTEQGPEYVESVFSTAPEI